jgi:PAS domain S-box-containing protein
MSSLEELLASLEGPLIAALNASHYGLTVTVDDGDGPYPVFASDGAVEILGYPRDELMARPSMSNIAPEELPRARALLEQRRARGGLMTAPMELVIVRKNGQRAAIEFGTAALPYRNGHATVAFFRDISDRRAMQSRLALADRMATVGTVAAGVAHEVNNPLTYVLLNLDRIETNLRHVTGDPDKMASLRIAVEQARDGAQRVRNIIADLRSFSTSPEESARSVDVRTVMSSAISIAIRDIREKATLEQCFDEVPSVLANEGKLGQVFLNLLVNAAQAIPEGAPDANQIRVTTRRDGGDRVLVEVADTGRGMPPDVLRRVFDPFFTTKPIGKGTGLGLSICHKIITSLGGEIEARGACFGCICRRDDTKTTRTCIRAEIRCRDTRAQPLSPWRCYWGGRAALTPARCPGPSSTATRCCRWPARHWPSRAPTWSRRPTRSGATASPTCGRARSS